MKDNLAFEIYLGRIKNLRHRIVNVGAILLIFIITVFLVFIRQSKKLTQYENEYRQLQELMELPWGSLQQLYESSFAYLEDYTDEIASPYSAICFLTGIDLMLMNGMELKEEDRDNPKMKQSIEEVTYAGRHLSKYVFDLRSLVAAQRTNTGFNSLNREKLLKVFDVYRFNRSVDNDSLTRGIEKALASANMFLKLDSIGKRPIKKMVLKNLYKTSMAQLDNKEFTSYETIMLIRNPHLAENFTDSLQSVFKERIEKEFKYDDLAELQSRNSFLTEAILEIKGGESINLPLLNFSVSIKEIFIYGGIMNLGILLYFYFMTTNLRVLQGKLESSGDRPLSVEEKEAMFFSLDYQINQKWIYLVLNTLFFSAVPLISVVFGFNFLGGFSEHGEETRIFPNMLIFVILIINFLFSVFISNKLFHLNKG